MLKAWMWWAAGYVIGGGSSVGGGGGGGGSWVTVTGFSASVAPRRRWRQLVPLHRRLISLATISGSHPSGQDHDGDQFHHANHQHWPQHTSKNSEQPMQRLRHTTVAEPAGRDQDTNHRDQASAQIHDEQHLDYSLHTAVQQTSVSVRFRIDFFRATSTFSAF